MRHLIHRQRHFIILSGVTVAATALFGPAHVEAQAECVSTAFGQVCASGVFPASPIIAEIGPDVVSLPSTQFTNNTDRAVTFSIDWVGGSLGGGNIKQVTLAAGTATSFSDLSIQFDSSQQMVGTRDITIGWSAFDASHSLNVTVARNRELVLVLPQQLREIIQVPVRWCAVQGSPQAEGQPSGGEASGKNLSSLLRRVNDTIWLPQASILFRQAPGFVPVIHVDPPIGFQPGDVVDLVGQFACENAWKEKAPEQQGIILLNARIMITSPLFGGGEGTTAGAAPQPAKALWVASSVPGTGRRGDDLCGHPRHLFVDDVTPVLKATVYDQALFNDPVTDVYLGDSFDPLLILAHELGHTLMLAHGNGLDDDGDGLLPPTPGPRRFDEICDPMGVLEDVRTPFTTCESSNSLMHSPASSCKNLQPLQREMAREVAKLVPGALITDPSADPAGELVSPPSLCPPNCLLSSALVLQKLEISETPDRQVTSFSLTVPELFPPNASNLYVVYADLDNNSQTGCGSAAGGLPISLPGAELVTAIHLNVTRGSATVTPQVWRCNGGNWIEINDPGVQAAAYPQQLWVEGAQDGAGPGVITIRVPDSVRGPAGNPVRLQAASEGAGGELNLLPPTGNGGLVSLIPSELPRCSVSAPLLKPGGMLTVTASSMPSNATADVFLGAQIIGTVPIDASGHVAANLAVPAISEQGVHSVEIRAQDGTANSVCAVLIRGAAITPATTATLSPRPNWQGWNKTSVAITLTALDVSGGPGIRELNYSATGAQSIAPTVQAGASATFTIDREGETAVHFFATNQAGVSEATETILIRVDKTVPRVACSASPNVLWPPNHEMVPVQVSISVSDALSGPAGFKLTSATSNEPLRMGDIQGFVIGSTRTAGRLRAARLGSDDDRIYTLTYTGADVAGNTASCVTTVTVPHDQSR